MGKYTRPGELRQDRFVTPAEAARLLGLSPYQIRLLTRHIRVWDKGPRLRLPGVVR